MKGELEGRVSGVERASDCGAAWTKPCPGRWGAPEQKLAVRGVPTGKDRSSSGSYLGQQLEAVGQIHASQEGILKGQLQGTIDTYKIMEIFINPTNIC